jgi:DNA ligase 1
MILLAKRWNESIDPTGWLISEKLDGFRAYWDGYKFVSRKGNTLSCPSWFTTGFQNEPLDGELWAGRGKLETVSAVVKGNRENDWHNIVYVVFDSPEFNGRFEERLKHTKTVTKKSVHAMTLPFYKCVSKTHLLDKLEQTVADNGEGLMLRKPGSLYERTRSDTLLKVKKWIYDKGVIIGHEEGNRPGLMGSFLVINKLGTKFNVGSGITEKIAHNPLPVGTIITYKYELLTSSGKPRTAVFVG